MSFPRRPLPLLLTLCAGALLGALIGLALLKPVGAAAVGAAAEGADGAAGPRMAGVRPAATPKRAKLRLRNSPYGKVIFEARSGLAAYLFTSDPKNASTCSGDCAKAWPPIKTRKRPAAGSGVAGKRLGTTRRAGGGKMVTYRGHPLYFYAHDPPGVVGCHDVPGFGGQWYAVNKAGKPA